MRAFLVRSFLEKVIETFTLGQELFLANCQTKSCTVFEEFVLTTLGHFFKNKFTKPWMINKFWQFFPFFYAHLVSRLNLSIVEYLGNYLN